MTFFHLTLVVRDGSRAIKTIVEHQAPSLHALIDEISDPEYPWLLGTEYRSVKDDDGWKWVSNPTAIAVDNIARINETRSPLEKPIARPWPEAASLTANPEPPFNHLAATVCRVPDGEAA